MSVPIAISGKDFMRVVGAKRNVTASEKLWQGSLDKVVLNAKNYVFPSVYSIPQRMPLRRVATLTDSRKYPIEHAFVIR